MLRRREDLNSAFPFFPFWLLPCAADRPFGTRSTHLSPTTMPPKAKGTSSGLKELNLSLSKAELVKRLKVCVSLSLPVAWRRPWRAFEHCGSRSPWIVPEFGAWVKSAD